MNRRFLALAAGLAGGIVTASPPLATTAAAEEVGKSPGGEPVDVIRLDRETEDGAMKLEVATIHCRRDDGASVDLVGAIHIADRTYFEALNKRFRDYDAVLFEMVGGDGDMAEKLARPADQDHPIRFFQVLLKNALDLSFQVDAIDYTAPNFVHADMTLEEFEQSRSESGETLETVIQRVFEELAGEEKKPATQDGEAGDPLASMVSFDGLFGLLTGQATAAEVKRDLAVQLADAEKLFHVIEGENGSVILGERNRKALEIVRRELAAGKRRLAVFYGAAHLPGIATLLENELGFRRDRIAWEPAWTVPSPAGTAESGDEADRPGTPAVDPGAAEAAPGAPDAPRDGSR